MVPLLGAHLNRAAASAERETKGRITGRSVLSSAGAVANIVGTAGVAYGLATGNAAVALTGCGLSVLSGIGAAVGLQGFPFS